MSYDEVNWDEDTDITADRLNQMDEGIKETEELANPQNRFQISSSIGGFDECYFLSSDSQEEIYETTLNVPAGKKLILKRVRPRLSLTLGDVKIIVKVYNYNPDRWEQSEPIKEYTPDHKLYENDSDDEEEIRLQVYVKNTTDEEQNIYSYYSFWLDLSIE